MGATVQDLKISVQVSLVHQCVPQSAVAQCEGTEVMFCSCVGNNHLVISIVGSAGGVQWQCQCVET